MTNIDSRYKNDCIVLKNNKESENSWNTFIYRLLDLFFFFSKFAQKIS